MDEELHWSQEVIRKMTVDALLVIRRACGVCVGHSPWWDGHDTNPPCMGAAKEEIMRRARAYKL